MTCVWTSWKWAKDEYEQFKEIKKIECREQQEQGAGAAASAAARPSLDAGVQPAQRRQQDAVRRQQRIHSY